MRKIFFATTMLVLSVGYADAKGHHRHHHHHHIAKAHHHHDGGGGSLSLAGFPGPLIDKAHEIIEACASRIISAFRPGAVVAGTHRLSNHALKKAVDIAGDPKCIYAHLHGWPGGYSTDYGSVHHVHISYNHDKEWGCRFAHNGGGHHARQYAHRHHHRVRYAHA